MTEEHQKEEMSKAYVIAVAAHAGATSDFYDKDYGMDGRICDISHKNSRFSQNGFGIDFQLKATTNIVDQSNVWSYDLEVKNYNDLIETEVGTPRILVVYYIPKEKSEWLKINNNGTLLKHYALWCSLKGKKETDNKSTIRIELPKRNIFTPNELKRLLCLVKDGADL